jgi:predicted TIM-barrel fold metal-dependent hydrolase
MFGWMFEVLAETKTPLLVSLQELDLRDAAAVKEAYPGLRLVITNTTQWMNRQYIRFAQYYKEVYFDTSNIIEYYGIENIVNLIGAERILFGTYMPEKEPYDKVFQLLYCELSEEQKQLIAHGNFERLVEER